MNTAIPSNTKEITFPDTSRPELQRSASWSHHPLEVINSPKRHTSSEDIRSDSDHKPLANPGSSLTDKQVSASHLPYPTNPFREPISLLSAPAATPFPTLPVDTSRNVLKTKPLTVSKHDKFQPGDIDLDEIAARCQSLKINGEVILPPENGAKLIEYIETIAAHLKPRSNATAVFQYGTAPAITLNLDMLGQGSNAAVYEILSGSENKSTEVFKLTHPKEKSINSVLKDIQNSEFWMEECKPKKFTVPEYTYCDGAGVFRRVVKSDGETLTKILLAMGIYEFDLEDPSNPSVTFHPERLNDPRAIEKLRPVAEAIEEMLEILNQNPEHCTSLSPNNIHVTCSSSPSERVDRLAKVELIDIGVNRNRQTKYKGIKSFMDYLTYMHENNCLRKYLTSEKLQYDVESLKEWQNASPYKKSSGSIATGYDHFWSLKGEKSGTL